MGIAILDNGRVVNSNTALNLTSLYKEGVRVTAQRFGPE